jgi:outer membrane usher protein
LLNVSGSAQSGRISFNALASRQSSRFRQVGQDPLIAPAKASLAASLGIGASGLGSFSVGYAYSNNRGSPDVESAIASYQVSTMRRAYFQALAVRNLSPVTATTVTLSLTIPFGPPDAPHSLDVAYQSQKQGDRRDDDTFVTLSRNLPPGPGYGYRLQTTASGDSRFGEVSLQTDFGSYAFAVQETKGRQTRQALVSGGLGVVGGHPFASRRIQDSFGLIEIPGVEGARVTADGQLIGRTSRDGTLLIPVLRAYDLNRINVEPADLPMDAVADRTQLDVVPYARSGVDVRLPIRRTRGATARLVQEDGQPVPSGAIARVPGIALEFTVGLDGAVYLTDLTARNEVTVRWHGRECQVTFSLPETADPLPELGTLTCGNMPK